MFLKINFSVFCKWLIIRQKNIIWFGGRFWWFLVVFGGFWWFLTKSSDSGVVGEWLWGNYGCF